MPKKVTKKRIPVYISEEAHQKLTQIAEKECRTLKATVELWIECDIV